MESYFIENSGCARKSACASQNMTDIGTSGLIRIMSFDASNAVNLIACQLGERAVTLLFENGTRVPLVTHYAGERLNAPSNIVWSDLGHLYFTDASSSTAGKISSGIYMLSRNDIIEAIPQKNIK